jgi:hypothetical protein
VVADEDGRTLARGGGGSGGGCGCSGGPSPLPSHPPPPLLLLLPLWLPAWGSATKETTADVEAEEEEEEAAAAAVVPCGTVPEGGCVDDAAPMFASYCGQSGCGPWLSVRLATSSPTKRAGGSSRRTA